MEIPKFKVNFLLFLPHCHEHRSLKAVLVVVVFVLVVVVVFLVLVFVFVLLVFLLPFFFVRKIQNALHSCSLFSGFSSSTTSSSPAIIILMCSQIRRSGWMDDEIIT